MDAFMDGVDQLYSLAQIDRALSDMALVIESDYKEATPLMITVMNGGLVTAGHLLPKLNIILDIDYCHATRYRNTTSGHDVEWLSYPQHSLEGRAVVLVDDIFDEGKTVKSITEYCYKQGAKSVASAVLLNKKHQRKVNNDYPDYIALDVDDRYVFGFGLDYQGKYRNAPGIFALPKESA